MNVKHSFYWLYEHGKSYNVFVTDTDDYGDEDANVVAKYQRYSTRLYIILLFVSVYLVFYATLLNPTVQTVTVSNLNENLFNELSDKYGTTLVCPCSSITIPYRNYLSNDIEFDPICSSLFVENEWVHSFYLVNASDYQMTDFRSVAHAQFELLSDFCSICKKKIVESESKFLSTDFVRINLVTKNEIESEMNGTIKVFRESLSNEMRSFLNYLRIYIRSNYFVSSLNTNLMLATYANAENSVSRNTYLIYQLQTGYAVNERADLGISLCGKNNPIIPIGFYPDLNTTLVKTRSLWSVPKWNTPIVDGFFAGCTPLEGILSSTLDCLYDIECIHLLSQYFPSINRFNFNNSISISRQSNLTVYDLFVDLFVQQWSTKVNYSSYFSSCSPMSCSYTRKDSVNWSYAITMFFGLYGGLTIILRILSPLIIQMLFQIRSSLGKLNLHNLSNLNIFKNRNQRSDDELRQQKLMTRLYLFLVLGCLLGFVLYSSLTITNITITILNPSLSEYKTYENLYTDRFRCRCSNPIISYQSLIQLNPTLHSICSSDFVSDRWLELATNIYDYTFEDWRNQASAQFNLLSRLCQLANSTISGATQQFLLQSLVTTNVLSENELNIHINSTLNSFFESTIDSFVSLIKLVHLSPQIDQLYMGIITTNWNQNADSNTDSLYLTNNQTNTSSLKVMFQLPGVRNVNLSSINCICAKNATCQSPIAIYQVDYYWNTRRTSYIDYIVPGSVMGCSNFDSLLFSQLYCFYSDSDCYSILMSRIKDSYLYNVEESVWFDPQPLIYNKSLTRFPKNTSISVLINQIMIEQWNPSYSYETFYELCSPNYCTYSQYQRTNTIVSILIILLSLFGGLTISLKIITPWIIKLIYRLRHGGQDHLNAIKLQLIHSMLFIRNNLIELNIFSARHTGNQQNQLAAKQIGIWSTRLFFSLFLLGLVILIFYSIFQLETVNLIFENPSLQSYQQLQMKYKEQLKCSCSNIALKYEHFVGMKADFHQICGSEYLSSEWRIKLSNGLNSNLSVYSSNDYRRFVLAHFEYLNSLCTYSIDLVNNSIKQFLNYAFITYELLTQDQFNLRLNSLIEQQKQTIPNEFLNLFSLIESINHRNGFVSMYGSNYRYVSPWYLNGAYYPYIPSRSISYDDQCSCSLQTNCSTKPFFIYPNASQIEIIGLKMGCSPTQSMHISTLECFYDEFCLNLLRRYTNLTTKVRPLSVANSQYSINTTISELIENLFVEQWNTSINYSLYYQQCSPSICSYTYFRYFNIVYLITILLGFQGGLTVILLWISPKIVRILMKISNKIRNNQNRVHSVNSTTNLQTNSNQQPNPHNERKLSFIKLFLICTFAIVIIVGLILFSVYIAQQTTTDSAIS